MSECNCPWRAVRLFWSNKLTTTSTNHWFFRPIINGVMVLSHCAFFTRVRRASDARLTRLKNAQCDKGP
jgi:hypothetical protein